MVRPRYPLRAVLDRERTTLQGLSDRTGIDYRTLQHWNRGGLAFSSADRLANRLGLHPATLWPSWMDDSIAHEAEKVRKQRERWARNKMAQRTDAARAATGG